MKFFTTSLCVLQYQKLLRLFLFLTLCESVGIAISAQTRGIIRDTSDKEERWSLHYQFTSLIQYHPALSVQYSGENSLKSEAETEMTITSTLFIGTRLWKGAEIFINPEIAGGSGFSGTTGLAGFPNGEAVRAGSPKPALYLARAFVRQSLPLSEAQTERVEDEANQLAGKISSSRLVFTAGKISILDIFDDNDYSHDARTQFMNWSLMAPGAWDFAADTRGYTWGFFTEYIQPNFSLNLGITTVPNSANGAIVDTDFLNAHSVNIEVVKPISLWGLSGKLHVIGFMNSARMGNYQHTTEQAKQTSIVPDITSSREVFRKKYGCAFTWEQTLSEYIGGFTRLSWNDGRNETWMFTEIDHSAMIGLLIQGTLWSRSQDIIGIATGFNGISSSHSSYLAHGGLGFIIGDGALRYAPEQLIEIFYNFRFSHNLAISADFQEFWNPAYNADRGHISVFSLRFHADFGEPQ